jgi:hypothetical protein
VKPIHIIGVPLDLGGGRRGVGTTAHCFHGGSVASEEIVDWKPHRYFSIIDRADYGELDMTVELVPEGEVTRLSYRVRPRGTPEQVASMNQALPMMEQVLQLSLNRAIALAGGADPDSAAAGATPA